RERALERQRLLEVQAEQRSAGDLIDREVPMFDPGMMEFSADARTANNTKDSLRFNLTGVQRFLRGDLEYSITQRVLPEESRESNLDFVRLKYYDDLRENELILGDTFTTFSPLLLNAATFRGASFYTGGRLLRFGTTTLIGTTRPGSEVDLYRRGILTAFTTADSAGFYQFDNLPLSQSSELFEIRIFTPQGRRFTEFRRVVSQDQMVPEGSVASRGGAGSSTSITNPFDVAGGEVRYGLFKDLTLGAYALNLSNFRVETGEVIETVNSTGVFLLGRALSWLNLLVERSQDSQLPGSAARLVAFISTAAGAVDLEHRAYEGEFAPPARTRTNEFIGSASLGPAILLSLDRTLLRTRFLAISADFLNQVSDYGQTRTQTERRARLARRITSKLSLNVSLAQERFSEQNQPDKGSDIQDALATYRLGFLTRMELRFAKNEPLLGEDSTRLETIYQKIQQIDSPWAFRAAYTTASNQDDIATVAAGYLFKNNFRISGQYDSQSNWSLQLEYSLPFRVSEDGLETFPRGSFGRGGIEGVVYLDENGDGIRQEDESTLSDVHILAPGVKNLNSDQEGKFKAWGLPTRSPISVEVDMLSTDALFVPLLKKQTTTIHPGELVKLEIALVPSGGLSGILQTRTPRTISPANGVEMILETENGERITAVQTEWDGTFIMEQIPPGNHILYGSPEQLAARGLALEPSRMRLLFPSGEEPAWHEDINFRITRKGGGELPEARSLQEKRRGRQ
ncbi:MAG: hypothetical protein O7G32_08390, partial [SAR324 cluster bacterium]|nr:hypothetical protein [SAR324 cluster bacterium]